MGSVFGIAGLLSDECEIGNRPNFSVTGKPDGSGDADERKAARGDEEDHPPTRFAEHAAAG